jgi:glycosyltransferase involved in cell wall biosynthesis
MLTTLHTPPLPMIESALALCSRPPRFVSVSDWTAAAWRHAVDSDVVLNGLELRDWPAGPGGGPAVWSGRLVPEKAPHLAIEACRLAGVPLVLAGPVQDPAYFDRAVAPLLGGDIRYAGHLDQRELSGLLRSASVAVVTPMWDEPYGLVAAEAMASGTPVAAFARGGLGQVVAPQGGVLAPPSDVPALAEAVVAAARLDRREVRAHAESTCSADVMVEGYLDLYDQLARRDDAA